MEHVLIRVIAGTCTKVKAFSTRNSWLEASDRRMPRVNEVVPLTMESSSRRKRTGKKVSKCSAWGVSSTRSGMDEKSALGRRLGRHGTHCELVKRIFSDDTCGYSKGWPGRVVPEEHGA
jgi:hypothetical protein